MIVHISREGHGRKRYQHDRTAQPRFEPGPPRIRSARYILNEQNIHEIRFLLQQIVL
jgi:hypothetical protein